VFRWLVGCRVCCCSLLAALFDGLSFLTPVCFLCNALPSSPLLSSPLHQIYPNGIRHISSNKGISEWRSPGKRTIKYATSNEAQVIVALTGGDVLCFELDDTGQLIEVGKKEFGQELACIEVGRVPEGRRRARFLAVGAWDNTVRVFSLDPSDILQQVCMIVASW
jgi:splicing factor 3B subunit 3